MLAPYLARRGWWWLSKIAHNWTGWIHQHLIAVALFLLDDEDDCSTRDAILTLPIARLDRCLTTLPADGGIHEGYSYFWNGACRLLEGIDLLVAVGGGLIEHDCFAKMEVIGGLLRLPQRMDLGAGWFINVADGPARPPAEQPRDFLHRWDAACGPTMSPHRPLSIEGAGRLRRRCHSSGSVGYSLRWAMTPGAVPLRSRCPPLPAETWLPDPQLLVARDHDGEASGLALAIMGGHNDEAYNHLDVGLPTYIALSFRRRRCEIWAMNSSWHNLPDINGHGQGVGAKPRARKVTARLRRPGRTTSPARRPLSGRPRRSNWTSRRLTRLQPGY